MPKRFVKTLPAKGEPLESLNEYHNMQPGLVQREIIL